MEDFNFLLEKIISYSLEINGIIKDLENNADNENVTVIVEMINNTYKERGILVEKLRSIFDNSNNKEVLLKDNPLWEKYNEKILPIEKYNTDFLNKKSIETKQKLTELSTNKSLLIYNPKVKLSYENKLI